MFVQNIKQSCDIYTGVEKIIVIGDAIAPGSTKNLSIYINSSWQHKCSQETTPTHNPYF